MTLNYLRQAKAIWDELLKDIDTTSVEDLAKSIRDAQFSDFEKRCGGMSSGKMIMGCSAAAYYYDEMDGLGKNGKKAITLRDAIQKSSCSMEVKSSARCAFEQVL